LVDRNRQAPFLERLFMPCSLRSYMNPSEAKVGAASTEEDRLAAGSDPIQLKDVQQGQEKLQEKVEDLDQRLEVLSQAFKQVPNCMLHPASIASSTMNDMHIHNSEQYGPGSQQHLNNLLVTGTRTPGTISFADELAISESALSERQEDNLRMLREMEQQLMTQTQQLDQKISIQVDDLQEQLKMLSRGLEQQKKLGEACLQQLWGLEHSVPTRHPQDETARVQEQQAFELHQRLSQQELRLDSLERSTSYPSMWDLSHIMSRRPPQQPLPDTDWDDSDSTREPLRFDTQANSGGHRRGFAGKELSR